MFKKELSADLVRSVPAQGAGVIRKAYELVGADPAKSVMTDPDAEDVSGLPQWQAENWSF